MAARPYYGAGSYIRTEEADKEDAEGRRRKVGTRRTVDYGCTNSKWLLDRLCRRSAYDEKPMRPALNDVINVASTLYIANDRCSQLQPTRRTLHHQLPSNMYTLQPIK